MINILCLVIVIGAVDLCECATSSPENMTVVGEWRDASATERVTFGANGTVLARTVSLSGEITESQGTYDFPIPGRIRIVWADGRTTTNKVEVEDTTLRIEESNGSMAEFSRYNR